jgi:hypothetical protein
MPCQSLVSASIYYIHVLSLLYKSLTSCIGWLLGISIDNDYAILSIKTEEDGQILKLRDSYHPGFHILPRNEVDGLHLYQVLSREEEISVRWEEDKHTDLFDSKKIGKLIHVLQ